METARYTVLARMTAGVEALGIQQTEYKG